MNPTDETWEMLGIKSKLAIITASVLILFGMGLTVAGFCVDPLGEISDTVMLVLGQCLLWSGSVYGVSIYMSSTKQGLTNYIIGKEQIFRQRLEEIEKNKLNE